MDKVSPGWRKDKKSRTMVKRAARKSVEMTRRFKFMSEKYNQPEPDVRRAYQICQDWTILNNELKLAKKENRKIYFQKLELWKPAHGKSTDEN